MAHHTHYNKEDGWYSYCLSCNERYGPAFGRCPCDRDPYDELTDPDLGPQWKFEKGNEPRDPFDVEPSSDPPDTDLMVDLYREECARRDAEDYDELNRRLDP